MTKTKEIDVVNHINNMVGVDDTPNPNEPNSTKGLERVKTLKPFTRILLDLFAVSLNPKIPEKGWKIMAENNTLDWKPNGRLVTLMPDDLFEFFQNRFKDIIDFDDEPKDIGGGDGFNAGRKYTMKDTSGAIQFRYFDPKNAKEDTTYVSGSPEENYVRQKVNLKITGDGLQVLRSRGLLAVFLKRLYQTFECDVTMFDIACDFFNYGIKPNDFHKLYLRKKYIGKSKLNVMGEAFNPTVYIGKYKNPRTIMLYDKLQENKDKDGSDEPELVEALEESGGDWLRLEQHFSRDRKEAKQAFDYLMIHEDIENVFEERLSTFLRQQVEGKCRFLSSPRKKDQNQRIKTHRKWELILGGISETKSDFAFERPVLTLDERMDNFMYRSIGGSKLFSEIMEKRGYSAYTAFMSRVAQHHVTLNRQKEIEELLLSADTLDKVTDLRNRVREQASTYYPAFVDDVLNRLEKMRDDLNIFEQTA